MPLAALKVYVIVLVHHPALYLLVFDPAVENETRNLGSGDLLSVSLILLARLTRSSSVSVHGYMHIWSFV